MNINNGKTGIIDIPGALHSTGGDGDGQIGGVVAYTGDIYDANLNRNQADINASTLHLDENHNLLINKDFINVEGHDNLLRGGAMLGYALSGSNSQYELKLYDDDWYKNNLHYQFVKFLQGSKILDGLTPVATITNATYNSSNKKITITTDTDLGELDGEYFNMLNQNIANSSFCSGMFLNKGGYSTLIGNDNYNTGYGNILLGDNNTNNGEQTVLIGSSNAIKSDTDKCYILGEHNTVNGESNLNTVGGYNTSTGDNLYSFALGGDINFTKGSTTGNDWLTQVGIGEYLNISQNEFVIGQYNKDYDIADSSKRNFFVVGNGDENTKANSLEQKANGDLYIKGIGNFDGTNSNANTTKSLQSKINDLQTQIDNVNTSNFYTKSEIDTQNVVTSTALNDLNDKVDNNESAINDLNDNVNSLQETVDELNEKAIKLNEYDEVNVTHPFSEEHEGNILCNLEKNDEKIIQDHPDWGSEFADYVSGHNVYIATNMGNNGIGILGEGEFGGYEIGEEIGNVSDSSNKSVIVDCFPSDSDYWIIETETELTINNMPYHGIAHYYQTRNVTPFRLDTDGSLHLMNVGGYNGDITNIDQSQSLQEVIDDLNDKIDNAGGVTSYNDLTDKPTILDNYDVTQIAIEKSPLHLDNRNNYVTYIPNGTNTTYTLNSITNTGNAVVVGTYNTLSNSDTSVVIGKSNTNSDDESVVIGASNNNSKDLSVVLGNSNTNSSHNGINIGYYNTTSTGANNVLLGNSNYVGKNTEALVIGNSINVTRNYNSPTDQKVVALGEHLLVNNSSVMLGFYSPEYTINGVKTTPYFTVANGTADNNRSNLLEQFDNGDLFIKGLGGFTGNNSQYDPRVKSLNTIISELQTKSTNNDTVINDHFTDNNSIKIGTGINVSGTDNIAGGAGVSLTGNRTFGYGISMGAIYLTGDEGTYSARLYNTSNYDRQNNVAKVFATTHLNSYLLNTSNFSRVAQITNIVYNGENQPLTLTLDTDLGNLSNAIYAIENVAGTKSFNAGCFGNTGQNSSVIGLNNFNTGNISNILGYVNANTAGTATVLGYLNKNNGNYSNILGSVNNNSAIYSNVIGLMNTNDSTGTYANIIGRNNTNKCSSTSIIGVGNTVNETTYPSVITGYENIADVATQQFTLGYGNHGTRGQYAEGNASASWMIGHHLTTSSGCWALGKYNKDYDVQDTTKQNFFVIGQGDTNAPLNSVELKRNGNLYIFNVGGFNGTNSDNANIKTLQTVISELQNTITSLQSRVTALENQLNGTNA